MTTRTEPRIIDLALAALVAEASQIEDAEDLDPSDAPGYVMIERVSGSITIVDGYHRAAGMIGWAMAQELDLRTTTIRVIDCTDYDEDVVAAAATPQGYHGLSQDDAQDQIIADAH